MSEPDARSLEFVGGLAAPVAILPTAAAPDFNHERAGRNGVCWFRSLGASNVDLVPVIDKASANDPQLAARVGAAQLIYLLGGFPRHLAKSLSNSLVWKAALAAYADGAVMAGSSAGAMVLCEYYYDPYARRLFKGLNLLPKVCVLPHHDHSGRRWAAQLSAQIPQAVLMGIDEQTGAFSDSAGHWRVYGAGRVTLYRSGSQPKAHESGQAFELK